MQIMSQRIFCIRFLPSGKGNKPPNKLLSKENVVFEELTFIGDKGSAIFPDIYIYIYIYIYL